MVGQTLGKGFVARGYEVKIGTRTPDDEKLNEWLESVGSQGSTGTFSECTEFGEILVLAVKGSAVEDVIALTNVEEYSYKVLIDVTNPLEFVDNGFPSLFVSGKDSLGESVQRLLPKAKVVKCWNNGRSSSW
jgi:hypothetical protein